MAAPHVTGLAALILEARPELSPEAVKTLIVGAAASMGMDKNVQGAGFVTGQKLFQILGGGMTVRLSTGLRKMWASTTSLQAILQTGVIDIYDGEQPVNPDYPPVGTHVARITQGGKTFSPGSATGGLLITTLDDGTVSMSGTWTLKGQATGTARWFRWKGNAFDDGGVSTALPRIDGKVGVDLLLQDVAMTTTTQFNVQGFTLSFS
jgi:hypothetical protein